MSGGLEVLTRTHLHKKVAIPFKLMHSTKKQFITIVIKQGFFMHNSHITSFIKYIFFILLILLPVTHYGMLVQQHHQEDLISSKKDLLLIGLGAAFGACIIGYCGYCELKACHEKIDKQGESIKRLEEENKKYDIEVKWNSAEKRGIEKNISSLQKRIEYLEEHHEKLDDKVDGFKSFSPHGSCHSLSFSSSSSSE